MPLRRMKPTAAPIVGRTFLAGRLPLIAQDDHDYCCSFCDNVLIQGGPRVERFAKVVIRCPQCGVFNVV